MQLSIDPGGTSGWATWHQRKLLDCHACSYECFPNLPDVTHILAELPEHYPDSPVRPSNLITLAYRLGVVVGPYVARGVPAKLVLPKEWKQQLTKTKCHARSWAKLSPAEQDIVTRRGKGLNAKALLDMLDAVALGQYAWLMGIWT